MLVLVLVLGELIRWQPATASRRSGRGACAGGACAGGSGKSARGKSADPGPSGCKHDKKSRGYKSKDHWFECRDGCACRSKSLCLCNWDTALKITVTDLKDANWWCDECEAMNPNDVGSDD